MSVVLVFPLTVRPDLPALFAMNSPYHNRLKLYLANGYRILDLVLTFQYDVLEKQISHNNLCQNVNACGHPRCVNNWCFALVSNGRQRELRRYLVLYKDIHGSSKPKTGAMASTASSVRPRVASAALPTPAALATLSSARLSDSGNARSLDSSPLSRFAAVTSGSGRLLRSHAVGRDALTTSAVSLPPWSHMRRQAGSFTGRRVESESEDAMDTDADDMDTDTDADQSDSEDELDDELEDERLRAQQDAAAEQVQFQLEAAVDEQLLRENPELDPFAGTAASPGSVLFSRSPPFLLGGGAQRSGCQASGELDFFTPTRPITHDTFDWNQTGSASLASDAAATGHFGYQHRSLSGSLRNSMDPALCNSDSLTDSRNWALTSYPQLGLSSSTNIDDPLYGGCAREVRGRRHQNRGLSYSGDSDDDLLSHRDYLM
jgi:hypothetical protein